LLLPGIAAVCRLENFSAVSNTPPVIIINKTDIIPGIRNAWIFFEPDLATIQTIGHEIRLPNDPDIFFINTVDRVDVGSPDGFGYYPPAFHAFRYT
jgi:hypothetical protein